jgi:hypothetical protein
MDDVLHGERLDVHRRKRLHPLTQPVSALPDGTMVASGDAAYMIVAGRLLLWSFEGYGDRGPPSSVDGLLTPPSIVAAFAAGYQPALHPSAVATPAPPD